MYSNPRPIAFKTYVETARMWPNLFRFLPTSIIFVVIAFPLVVMVSQFADGAPVVDYDRILNEGTTAQATVIDIETQENITVNNEHPHIIGYRYLNEGKDVNSKFRTLDDVYELSEGDKIQIKYLGDDSIIPSLSQFDPFWIFAILPAVFFLGGLIPLLTFGYLVMSKIRLYQYGVVTNAEILSISREEVSRLQFFIKSNPISKVDYQYKGDTGRTYVEHARSRDLILSNTLKQGDTIKIFVSPDDESKSTLIPKTETVRNNWKID